MYENGSLSNLVKDLVSRGVTRHNGKRLESAHTSVQLTE
jgi:hypothetical protein